jgi:hypothetical protein
VSPSQARERPARLACRGRCRTDPARRAHHDRLLQVESDPDAMVDLFEMAVTWAEFEYPAETTIPPHEWPDLAGSHRWHDAERMQWIFGLAAEMAGRAAPGQAQALPALGLAAGSGIRPAPDPVEPRPRLRVAGR